MAGDGWEDKEVCWTGSGDWVGNWIWSTKGREREFELECKIDEEDDVVVERLGLLRLVSRRAR